MERLGSRLVYENRWMRVREDEVRLPDGSTGIYGVVDKPDFALVVPRGPGGFWMVEQYRYPIGRRAWEFPQGSWPHGITGTGDGHRLAEAELAEAELAEETGLRAASWTRLGRLSAAYGFCAQWFDVWLAADLVEGEPDREHTEQDVVHRFVTDDELGGWSAVGDVVDGHTLAALALYRRHVETRATSVPSDRL